MTNENCLEGMVCPKCGQEEKFSIVCSCVAVWKDDGCDYSEDVRDVEFDGDSNCRCVGCNFSAKVKDFKK